MDTYLADHPVDFCYELANPIYRAIDPKVIRLLKGTNTIYSDANGTIDFTYWNH